MTTPIGRGFLFVNKVYQDWYRPRSCSFFDTVGSKVSGNELGNDYQESYGTRDTQTMSPSEKEVTNHPHSGWLEVSP
jgi:hypothetical protein